MAGNTSTPGATVTVARAGAARRLRRAAPRAHAVRARAAGRASRCPPRTGWSASWSTGVRWTDAQRASTSWGGGCGTSACSRRCRPGCGRWPRRSCTTCTAPRWPPCTSPSATAIEVLYLRPAGRATRRCRSSARSASRLPMHAPASARCCSPTRRPRCATAVLAAWPGSRRTRSPRPDAAARQLEPDPPRRVRDDGRGDDPRRVLVGGAGGASVGRASWRRIGIVVATLKRDRQRLLAALQVAARGIGRLL